MGRIALLGILVAALLSTAARADTEVDRLRDAVRSMTGQLRALEDQRAQAQGKLAQAEKEKTLAVQAAGKLKDQLKEAQQQLRDAVDEFNKRLANRDDALEKWKAAYAQAADVAREKDALRAKFEEEAGTFKARTKSCEARNRQLLRVSGEVLAAYRNLTPLDEALIKEPMIGIARVGHENQVQCFQDKILDQDAKLPAAEAAEKTAAPAATQPTKDQGGKKQSGDQSQSGGARAAPAKPGTKPKPQESGSRSGAGEGAAPAASQDVARSNAQN
jgi:chromosome segregation ATPase